MTIAISRNRILRQVIQIAGKAIRVLFHKNNLIWHPGNFMETQISKKEG